MYNSDRSGVVRQDKAKEPRPRDGWRSGSSADSERQEKEAPEKKEERVRLVQIKGKVRPVRI